MREQVASEARHITRKTFAWLAGTWIMLPLFFLVNGRSLGWWQAWTWCAIVLVPTTAFAIRTVRTDPDFLARRFMMREKDRLQRGISALAAPFQLAAITLPGLDRRFGWSEVPTAAAAAALIVSLAGYLLILRAFAENRWAGRTVEVFDGQKVVATGPYAIVRHPMYVGGLVLWLATPVALGSWWALLPALAILPFLVLRIRSEEETLEEHLTGYEDYRRAVRFRLLPFVW